MTGRFRPQLRATWTPRLTVIVTVALASALSIAGQEVGDGAQIAPISTLRVDRDGDGVSDLAGEPAIVVGVVTYEAYGARGGDETRAYIQDETGGLRLLAYDPGVLTGLNRWDRVRAYGRIDDDRGTTELLVDSVVPMGPGDALQPLPIEVGEASSEVHEGRLVEIQGTVLVVGDNVYLEDKTGRVRLYLRSSILGGRSDVEVAGEDRIGAVGIVEHYLNSAERGIRYRVTPRSIDDLYPAPLDRTGQYLSLSLLGLGTLILLTTAYVTISRRKAAERERLLSELRASELALRAQIAQREAAEQEKLKALQDLNQAQRVRSVGELAGGIAHDINNALTAIVGSTDLALSEDPDPQVEQHLIEVLAAGDHVSGLVRKLLAYARRQTMEAEPLDAGAFVNEALALARRVLREDVLLESEVRSTGVVNVDPTQLTQVLLNLCLNSSQSMPRGGTIRLVVDTCEVDGPMAVRGGTLKAGKYVVVQVEDEGHGMSPEVLGQAFDPFFTTRGENGSGLGLSSVLGIVTQTGGGLRVESELERGTRVSIYLPQFDGVAHAQQAGGVCGGEGLRGVPGGRARSAVRG